jgi:transcription-repair coupling factor (superfamily II helicase)
MLGAEQSGFIADLGYETYQKVLNEAVTELRQTEFAELFEEEKRDSDGELKGDNFVDECNIESDLPAFLPEEYVPVSGERMALYRELDTLTTSEQLDAFRTRLIDRFGALPAVGEELLLVMPLKWAACRLGVEKIMLKQGRMALYFVSDTESAYYSSQAFGKVLTYAAWHPRECRLRDEGKRSMLITGITSFEQALSILTKMKD